MGGGIGERKIKRKRQVWGDSGCTTLIGFLLKAGQSDQILPSKEEEFDIAKVGNCC